MLSQASKRPSFLPPRSCLMLTPLEMFTPLCTISADTSHVSREPRDGPDGVYYVQSFKIVFLCGLTEMQAQLSWVEDVRTTDAIPLSRIY